MGQRRGRSRGRCLRCFLLVLFLFHQVAVLMLGMWEVFVVGTRMLVLYRCGGHAVLCGGGVIRFC